MEIPDKLRLATSGRYPALGVFFLLVITSAHAADPVNFHHQVMPILERRCLMCHGVEAAGGGLILTEYKSLRRGGKSGPAVVSGDIEGSLLWRMISGSEPRMPKAGGPLAAEEVELIRLWIAQGAKDDTPGQAESGTWWSFRPLAQPPIPAIDSSWIRSPVDQFILAKMKEKGLTPSPEADRRTLIRRITFDLHGLPPTREEIEAFVNDTSEDAYEKLIDRLLASPRYGERWGRHWLDVVHYGESHGFDKDKPRPNAWPYRDYVIRSFNEDKPYARFVAEQLAGDVLFPEDPQGIVATGFIAAGPWDFVGHVELREGTVEKKKTRLLDRDDMVATAMSTFTSLTVHCARCHDHKFDPITQEDYYSLQAVFAGVERAERPYDLDPAVHHRRLPLLKERRVIRAALQPFLDIAAKITSPEVERIDEQVKALRKESAEISEQEESQRAPDWKERQEKLTQEIDRIGAERKKLVRSLLEEAVRVKLEELEGELKAVESRLKELPEPRLVYGAANDFEKKGNFSPPWTPRPIHLLRRGSVEAPGELMAPGAVTALGGLASRFHLSDPEDEGARRAALARWIIDPRNPLTWRSIVNRVWHYHFGRGIVDSPNDFGRMGARPTHPRLLDWLARELENGGSLKKLHRLILRSAVYRQSSAHHAGNDRIDTENRFLWRMHRRRLDAESLRDTFLFLSGKLDLTPGGPSVRQFVFTDDHSPRYDYTAFDVDSPASFRRSVYRFIIRSVPDPMMEILDCPDPSLLTPKRNVTLTAQQALVLLNDPLVVRQVEHFAGRLQTMENGLRRQIEQAYRLAFGRKPQPEESRTMISYAAKHGLANACRLIFNSNEFVFID